MPLNTNPMNLYYLSTFIIVHFVKKIHFTDSCISLASPAMGHWSLCMYIKLAISIPMYLQWAVVDWQ